MNFLHKTFVLFFLATTFSVSASFPVFPEVARAATEVTEDITEDTTWNIEGSPYVVRNPIIIDPGATLIVEPGVVVKFARDAGLDVFGAVQLVGTADAKIAFTTLFDDSIGGDTNGDGSTTGAGWTARGDWNGISLYTSAGASLLQNIIVNYSDGFYLDEVDITIDGLSMTDNWQNMGIYGGTVAIYNCDFRNTKGYTGIYVYGTADLSIEGSTFDGAIQADMVILDEGSTIDLSGSTFRNIQGQALYVTDSSVGRITQTVFDSIADDAIVISGNSTIDFDGVTIKNTLGWGSGGIYAFYNGTATIRNSFFDTGTYGVLTSDGAAVTIENTEIKNFTQAGIMDFGGSTWKIQNSTIHGNDYGIYVYYDDNYSNSTFDAKNNKIYDNTSANAYNNDSTVFTINLANNYWGNVAGPYHVDTNPGGLGGAVSDGIAFTPWCVEETCTPLVTRDPVIIIPGITGTILNKNYDDFGEVWPNADAMVLSLTDNFLDSLKLDDNGNEDPSKPISLGDIVRSVTAHLLGKEIANVHIFDNMIADLEAAGYVEDEDLFVFPYDWRFPNERSAQGLKNAIDEVLTITGKSKVDILAHSMGGIVAKKYIADNGVDKIDQLFFLGTPHLGSPKAFKTLMYGDNMGFRYHSLNTSEIKSITQNMPAMFELLPSKSYFEKPEGKYVFDIFDNYKELNGLSRFNLEYDDVVDLMNKAGRNSLLLSNAQSIHDSIDSIDLSSTSAYNFVGCGTSTLGQIVIGKKKRLITSIFSKVVNDYALRYTNGDGTVPIISASSISSGETYFAKGISHGALPDSISVRQIIISLLSGETPDMNSLSDMVSSIDDCSLPGGVEVSSHSPVELHIYDSEGNHTGPNADGDIEYNILGVQYDVIEGEKFAFLPTGGQYRVVLIPTDTGAYNFYVEIMSSNGEKTGETYFDHVPVVSLSERHEMIIDASTTEYKIKTDTEGDGDFEKTVLPSSVLSDTTTAGDMVPPETIAKTDIGMLTLSAVDDNAGILKTEYSLDGDGWVTYTASFDATGKTVQYFSTDKAGNIEIVKEVIVPSETAIVILPKRTSGGGITVLSTPPNNENTLLQDVRDMVLESTIVPIFAELPSERFNGTEDILKKTNPTPSESLVQKGNAEDAIQTFGGDNLTALVVNANKEAQPKKERSATVPIVILGGMVAIAIGRRFIKV